MVHELQLTAGELRIGATPVLSDVDVTFRSGVTHLLGPNGAGKSTLLRALAGLLPLGSGQLVWDGETVRPEHCNAHRARVAWLPQSADAPGGVTAEQLMHHVAWFKRIPRREADHAVRSSLATTDTSDLASRRIGRMSGGQKQRVLLAAALLGDPQVVLLDEPTTGLDVAHRRQMTQLVNRIADQGTIVVGSTHHVEDVLASPGDVVVVSAGQVTYHGAAAELAGGDVTHEALQAGLEHAMGLR